MAKVRISSSILRQSWRLVEITFKRRWPQYNSLQSVWWACWFRVGGRQSEYAKFWHSSAGDARGLFNIQIRLPRLTPMPSCGSCRSTDYHVFKAEIPTTDLGSGCLHDFSCEGSFMVLAPSVTSSDKYFVHTCFSSSLQKWAHWGGL